MAASDLALLKKLISIPSPYPQEEALGQYVGGLFLKKGYEVYIQRVEGKRHNIIVEKGKGARTVLLYNHLDTVAPVAGWDTDPYRPVLRGDRMYGLGSYDMKGGMAANILAFLNFDPKRIKLRILFCVDEENISKGGYAYAASRFMKDTACVLSPEPAFDNGVRGIVTGRIGRAVIEMELKNDPVHYFYYDPAKDITAYAARIIDGLKKEYRARGDRKEFVYVRSINADTVGMSTPGTVRMELETSILPPHTTDDILKRIRAVAVSLLKGSGIAVRVDFKKRETPFLSGYETKRDDPYYLSLAEAAASRTGKPPVPYFRSSVADENIFGAAGIPVFGLGPEGGSAHGPNEWVSVSSVGKVRDIYLDFLKRVDR